MRKGSGASVFTGEARAGCLLTCVGGGRRVMSRGVMSPGDTSTG